MSKTPKKIYAASSDAKSYCRLCKSAGYSTHCKNLFGKAKHIAAEEICGSSLGRSEFFPHLIRRPCEWGLKNFIAFATLSSESQRSLERVKRCFEESLFALRSLKTSKWTDKPGNISPDCALFFVVMVIETTQWNHVPFLHNDLWS